MGVHNAKIQTKSGDSLADTYDVVGSVAGLEFLDTEEVKTVHEMGGTIFSERASGRIRTFSQTLAQSLDFATAIADLSGPPFRLYGVIVVTSVTARIATLCVSWRGLDPQTEHPIWVWDGTNEDTVRFDMLGIGTGNRLVLRPIPEYSHFPYTGYGPSQPFNVGQLILRGTTTAFGAGTVEATVNLYQAVVTSNVVGSESRGVPIPSW